VIRRCGCGGDGVPVEVQRFGPVVLNERFECRDCTTRFDVATPLGSGLLIAVGVLLSGYAWLADPQRFAHGDRGWILLFLGAISVAAIGVGVQGFRMRRRHPKP
jgi:hypothetical protein